MNHMILYYSTWGHWDGGAENPFSAQKYERGQNCWNGPDRSVRVSNSQQEKHCGMNFGCVHETHEVACGYQKIPGKFNKYVFS